MISYVLIITYLVGVILFEIISLIPYKEDGFSNPLDNWYSNQIRIYLWPIIALGGLIVLICYVIMCIILRFEEWMALDKQIYLWPRRWY